MTSTRYLSRYPKMKMAVSPANAQTTFVPLLTSKLHLVLVLPKVKILPTARIVNIGVVRPNPRNFRQSFPSTIVFVPVQTVGLVFNTHVIGYAVAQVGHAPNFV